MYKNYPLKKIFIFIMSFVLISTIFFPVISSNHEGAGNSFSDGPMSNSASSEELLDVQYICNIAKDLSDIVKTEYDESKGEIAKGRAFGTKGEHKAAEILYEYMDELGLNPIMEKIKPIESLCPYPQKLTEKLEVVTQGLTVNNELLNTDEPVTDLYISPRWDFTGISSYISNIKQGGWFDEKYNVYDKNRLNYNFSYSDLEVRSVGETQGLGFDGFMSYIYDKLTTRINDLSSWLTFLLENLEDYYNFTFEELETEDGQNKVPWTNDIPVSSGDFVFIEEDPAFNPNAEEPDWLTNLRDFFDKHELLDKLLGGKTILKGINIIKMIIWRIAYDSHCKGLIRYDFNKDTYDMNLNLWYPLPILYINKTVGEKIEANANGYTINFHINQFLNESVISYNVVGQLDGTTHRDKTVIIGCLYDSWWCQGTADSAIGMAMVLAVAKYFKDYNLTPKCNLKFIAFGGEEYGSRGAYFYEAAHRDENVDTIIDLNQVGFYQNDPRLTLYIMANSDSLKSTVEDLTSGIDYIERTGNTADFEIVSKEIWYVGNYHPYSHANSKGLRSCNILYIVKDTAWKLHHRDGLKHTKGDTMDYFDWDDVSVTAEIVLNLTKHFTNGNLGRSLSDNFTYERPLLRLMDNFPLLKRLLLPIVKQFVF